MARRKRVCPAGEVFHALNRAVARMTIFEKPADYEAFMRALEETWQLVPLPIFAMAVMPNHWHFVVRPTADDQVSMFFQRLTVTHSLRWHAHYKTGGTGHLSQGRFKSFPIQQEQIYPILKSFRLALATFFTATHPLVVGLPDLTPAPGSTPDGVTINAVWNVPSLQAKLTWAASTEANVEEYEIRFCPGPSYSTDDESVVGNVPAGPGPFEFLTDAGLSAPGNIASFKVYVVTTTGNEKGSNAVAVTRP